LEPSRELVERFNPSLLPFVKGLEGHGSMFSNGKLRRAVGWEPRTSWRRHLKDRVS